MKKKHKKACRKLILPLTSLAVSVTTAVIVLKRLDKIDKAIESLEDVTDYLFEETIMRS